MSFPNADGDIFWARNLTQDTEFIGLVEADTGDVIQFRVRICNPGPDPIGDVRVRSMLPDVANSDLSTVVETTAPNADPTVITDTATVKVNEPSILHYIAGSTVLGNSKDAIRKLPETIFSEVGVNIGTVGVSLSDVRFVQFFVVVEGA